ncbi:unnamed protein product [Phytophthora fragariaefolia]|uniref:Unnamed protein product n=1 Tax=Phytophthora fragariaefolia TaxID=1490495 RepID=A0A9W6XDL6_9STRA|nr:unnamed protein product [Phytophthora fragariaefolia]
MDSGKRCRDERAASAAIRTDANVQDKVQRATSNGVDSARGFGDSRHAIERVDSRFPSVCGSGSRSDDGVDRDLPRII